MHALSGLENMEGQRSYKLVTHPEDLCSYILAYLKEIIRLE